MKKILLFGALFLFGTSGAALFGKTLVGASQFNQDHAYSKGLQRFTEEMKACSLDLKFRLALSSGLGLEKDYLNFMARGNGVDFAIVSPGHMANYSNPITIMSMPFLFRDREHWNAVLKSSIFDSAVKSFEEKADVLILGYAGGSVRNIIANRPVKSAQDIQGLQIRVQGAPIHTKIWAAIGAEPSVISYSETYNAIQTNVVEALENGADSFTTMKFHEVAPYFGLTRHTITIRPLLFSGKTFRKLDKKNQACVKTAGKKAADYARGLEVEFDQANLDRFVSKGLVKPHEIEGYEQILKKATQVKREFAENIDALDILDAVEAINQ